MTPVGLEIRYRRLLRWYPAAHRSVHHDEMLGVLMAGAEPGRNRPRLAESADLLLGAARIRLRSRRALSDGQGWRDALAVYSIATPLLVLISTVIGRVVAELEFRHIRLAAFSVMPPGLELVQQPLIGLTIWLGVGIQALVAVLALLGLRRWAAAAAAISALYLGVTAVLSLYAPLSVGIPISVLYIPFALVVPISETVALLASPGPRRGRQLMRRQGWALLAAGSVAALTLTRNFRYTVISLGGESLHVIVSLLALLLVAALLLGLWLSSAHGKRLALLFGVLAYGLLLVNGFIDAGGAWGADTIDGSAGQVLVIVLLVAVIYRTWRRSRSAAGGSGQGLA